MRRVRLQLVLGLRAAWDHCGEPPPVPLAVNPLNALEPARTARPRRPCPQTSPCPRPLEDPAVGRRQRRAFSALLEGCAGGAGGSGAQEGVEGDEDGANDALWTGVPRHSGATLSELVCRCAELALMVACGVLVWSELSAKWSGAESQASLGTTHFKRVLWLPGCEGHVKSLHRLCTDLWL